MGIGHWKEQKLAGKLMESAIPMRELPVATRGRTERPRGGRAEMKEPIVLLARR